MFRLFPCLFSVFGVSRKLLRQKIRSSNTVFRSVIVANWQTWDLFFVVFFVLLFFSVKVCCPSRKAGRSLRKSVCGETLYLLLKVRRLILESHTSIRTEMQSHHPWWIPLVLTSLICNEPPLDTCSREEELFSCYVGVRGGSSQVCGSDFELWGKWRCFPAFPPFWPGCGHCRNQKSDILIFSLPCVHTCVWTCSLFGGFSSDICEHLKESYCFGRVRRSPEKGFFPIFSVFRSSGVVVLCVLQMGCRHCFWIWTGS